MKKVIYGVLSSAPILALAQTAQTTNLSGVRALVNNIGNIINNIIPVLFALAIVYFFWGVIQFLRAGGDAKMHEQGKAHMIYGIIALVVMATVFGIITWIQGTLNISGNGQITLPTVIIPS